MRIFRGFRVLRGSPNGGTRAIWESIRMDRQDAQDGPRPLGAPSAHSGSCVHLLRGPKGVPDRSPGRHFGITDTFSDDWPCHGLPNTPARQRPAVSRPPDASGAAHPRSALGPRRIDTHPPVAPNPPRRSHLGSEGLGWPRFMGTECRRYGVRFTGPHHRTCSPPGRTLDPHPPPPTATPSAT